MKNKEFQITTDKKMVVRDPQKTEHDVVNMSEAFLDRFLSPQSKTSSWTILQKKIFILMVGQLKSFGNGNKIILDNQKVMRELGWNYSQANFYKVGFILRDELDKMMESKLRLQDIITKKWYTGYLIVEAEGDINFTKITLNPTFMNHFNDLYYLASKYKQSYFGLMKPDVMELKNDYAHRLYCDLRMQFKVKDHPITKEIVYQLPDLLQILGVDEWDYIKGGNKEENIKGKFNFYGFEKRILDVVITNINTSEQIRFNQNSKGEFYEKVKNGRRITGYKFKVTVNDVRTIKANRESLITLAKRQGFYVEIEPDWANSMPIDEDWHGNWNIKEKESIDSELIEETIEEDFVNIDLLDLPECFNDYDTGRQIAVENVKKLEEVVKREEAIQIAKEEILKNERLIKELESQI